MQRLLEFLENVTAVIVLLFLWSVVAIVVIGLVGVVSSSWEMLFLCG